ncbi:MAG: hypothetical protein K2K82_00320 [Muribaculaceae bacterium]|nr:hypothetical protein [Muribaculaceae bacterium]
MKRLMPLSFLLFVAGCSVSQPDLTGRWSRQAEEPAMELSGTEIIEILPDSTFKVTNRMLFAHNDSDLNSFLNVKVSVYGTWDRTNQGDLLMLYNPQTVSVDADSTSFTLNMKKADKEIPAEIAAETYADLITRIKGYYTQGYGSISANGGMLLQAPQVIDSTLYARIGSEIVTWSRP